MAVFVFDGIWSAPTLQLSTLSVTSVGAVVYPTEAQVANTLRQFFPSVQDVGPGPVAGHMWSWWGMVGSAQALVDRRDGAVLFGGTVVWAGSGHLMAPLVSTHGWAVSATEPAAEPAQVMIIENSYWETVIPTESQLAAKQSRFHETILPGISLASY